MPALRRLLDARAASWGRAAWALPARAGAACRTGSGRCAGRLWAPLGDARLWAALGASGRCAERCWALGLALPDALHSEAWAA